MKRFLTKKNVIITAIIVVVLILGTTVFGVRNYNAYNSYINEFKEIGYDNKLFNEGNKLVKPSTLSYMQYILDTYINDTNKEIKELDILITTNNLKQSDTGYKNITEEVISKRQIVKDYLEKVNNDYKLNVSDINIDNVTKAMNDKVTKEINAIKLPSDKAYTKELTALKDKLTKTNDLTGLISLSKEKDNVIKLINQYNDKKTQEANTKAATSSSGSRYSTNNSSSRQSSGSSNSSSATTGRVCAYKSASAARAAGEASGRGYIVLSCAKGTWEVSLYDGDHTGNNGGTDNSNLFD